MHHIEPYRVSRNNHPSNLVTACRSCHARLDRIGARIASQRDPALRACIAMIVKAALGEFWHLHQGRRLLGDAHMITPKLQIVRRRLDALTLDPANARKHGRRNLDAIKGSLTRFGQVEPIVVQKSTGRVIGGNGRLEVLREMGADEADVVELDVSDIEATSLGIALNRTAELAEWDETTLADLLEVLRKDPSVDMDAVGFSDSEVDRLLAAMRPDDPAAEEVPQVPANPVTKPGDLYALGEHRLLCGDATRPEDVARLLAGETPFLMVTDPPYGVEYDPEWREAATGHEVARKGKVRNDDRADWSAAYQLFAGDVAYVWHAALFATTVATNLEASGFDVRAQLIWRKPRLVLSRGAYHWQHEPAWYAVRRGRTARWCGDRTQSTVWEIAGKDDTGETHHGTQKPVETMERPMRNHGARGDVVYDPFLGSGTSIIAAQRAGRRCFGLELDPGYCDVIVERWETYTGGKAERRPGPAESSISG